MEAARALLNNRPPDQGLAGAADSSVQLRPLPSEEGFLDSDAASYVLAHGSVEVPGAGKPINYTASVPLELASPLVHMIIPGFGGIKRSSRGLRNAMAEQEGRLTVSYEPARGGGTLRDIFLPQRVHADTVEAILQDLPNNTELQDAPHFKKLDMGRAVLAPHSMGSLPATEHARTHPEQTESVIYMGSIGLEGGSVGLGFIPRLAGSTSGDVAGKYVQGKLVPGANRLHLARRTAHYYLSNLKRTGGEIITCLTADIEKTVRLFEVLGVKTGALYFGRDRLVPADEETVEATVDMVHVCEIMEGYGHLAPQRHPYDVAARLGSMSTHLEQLPEAA